MRTRSELGPSFVQVYGRLVLCGQAIAFSCTANVEPSIGWRAFKNHAPGLIPWDLQAYIRIHFKCLPFCLFALASVYAIHELIKCVSTGVHAAGLPEISVMRITHMYISKM